MTMKKVMSISMRNTSEVPMKKPHDNSRIGAVSSPLSLLSLRAQLSSRYTMPMAGSTENRDSSHIRCVPVSHLHSITSHR